MKRMSAPIPALTESEIDRRITEWHDRDHVGTLHDYLGWTQEEYERWVTEGTIPSSKMSQAEWEACGEPTIAPAAISEEEAPVQQCQSVTFSHAEAEQIADALLSGCFALTEAQRPAAKGSLEAASATNTYNALRQAMKLVEGALGRARPTPPEAVWDWLDEPELTAEADALHAQEVGGTITPTSEWEVKLQAARRVLQDGKPCRVRINRCSCHWAWYKDRVGQEVSVFAVDSYGYWTRDTGPMRCSQWIKLEDATLLE